jgi:hypothetical protein
MNDEENDNIQSKSDTEEFNQESPANSIKFRANEQDSPSAPLGSKAERYHL